MNDKVIIETERLVLRQYRLEDADEVIRRQKFVSRGSGKIENEYITGLLKDEWIK